MDGTIAEIRMFAGNFAPRNWLFCRGQLIAISQNTALFSLVGTTYGGNGQTNFAIPDLQGRVPVGTGTGAGLSTITLGQKTGTNTTTLNITNIPAHTHAISGTVAMAVNSTAADAASPVNNYFANDGTGKYNAVGSGASMKPANVSLGTGIAGSGLPINNMMPYIGMNYIICQFGIFPSRN